MDTVLVTGGAGLIGASLSKRLLDEGYRVVVIDDFSSHDGEFIRDLNSSPYFILKRNDILDPNALNTLFEEYSFDIIFHLAANTSIPKGQDDVQLDIRDTFLSTISVLEQAAKHRVKKFVFTSSSTVYGRASNSIDEQTTMHPVSYYGAAKMSCEAFISAYSSRYNIQTWIVRLCNVIGPDVTHGIIKDIKHKLLANNSVLHLLGDGYQEKPFMYVDDAVDGLLYVVRQTEESINTFLVGNEDTITVRRIAEIALEENGLLANIVFDSASTWSGDVQKYKFDTSKVRLLGWKPRYNSEAAIRKSIKL